jgi:hypothetical protein
MKIDLRLELNMSRKIFILLLLGLAPFSFSCMTKSEKSCEHFKTGTYLFNQKPPGGTASFVIDMDDSIQTQTEKSSGKIERFLVKWVEPCVYEMRTIETKFNGYDSVRIRTAPPVRVQIVTWTKKYLLFESTSHGFRMRDTMWILN